MSVEKLEARIKRLEELLESSNSLSFLRAKELEEVKQENKLLKKLIFERGASNE